MQWKRYGMMHMKDETAGGTGMKECYCEEYLLSGLNIFDKFDDFVEDFIENGMARDIMMKKIQEEKLAR
jgi:uncharacterized membrane protein YjdF